MKIKIKWLQDEYDCEDCGTSYAEGAEIMISTTQYELRPVAHCFGGQNFDKEEVLKFILAKLGYEVEESYE